ncbi:MAG TPA: hypothetical protein VFB38_02295 [Chthonomonadaceae bacterium]|nr:hypothetical protein [Chthonomonadaceae bacterium]
MADMLVQVIVEELTPSEQARLAEYETTIGKHLQQFFEVGYALMAIRDQRLYRSEYSTFEEYCGQRWGFTKTHANRLIAAAGVVENLTPIGVTPSNEAQVRPLTKLAPDQQAEAWREAQALSPEGKVTASLVDTVVRKRLGDARLSNGGGGGMKKVYAEGIEYNSAQNMLKVRFPRGVVLLTPDDLRCAGVPISPTPTPPRGVSNSVSNFLCPSKPERAAEVLRRHFTDEELSQIFAALGFSDN